VFHGLREAEPLSSFFNALSAATTVNLVMQ
jgi:hypothetical protein